VQTVEERRQGRFDYSNQVRSKSRAGVEPMPATITGKWLSACINRMLGKDSILVNEYPIVLEEMEIREPGRYYANSPAGGPRLGHGAALGAKARFAGEDRDLRPRRRLVHVRQSERRALRLRSDAPPCSLHHRQQRALGGCTPLHARYLSKGYARR